ncbi:MAG: uL15 family ribosomal protein [Candidatus Woesearchaeota archaeon]|nr:MAG: uL15 family ribosomal protein [Candidatus Woesearchaeota archaeon]
MVTTRKKKKSRKFRGDSTHGWGARKRHRGAGHRAGRGMAGSGKRRGMKEPTFLAHGGKPVIGKRGMITKRKAKKLKTINLYQLDKEIENLVKNGFAKQEKTKITVDLGKTKYDKLLGTGSIRSNVFVKVDYYSKKAEEKLNNSKGGIIKS